MGKVRHLDVCHLWLQSKVSEGEMSISTVSGPENPADLMTKGLPRRDIERHLLKMQCPARRGRHQLGFQLNALHAGEEA